MAKIKLRYGEYEIEIDSRDFYVDNQSLGQIIESIATHLEENKGKMISEYNAKTSPEPQQNYQNNLNYLSTLENAEVHEPEYSEPVPIFEEEIRDKIHLLDRNSFFETPRTVSEIVSQLREYGWSASSLHVSKTLAKMAFNKEIQKNSYENRCYYANKTILAN